MPAVSLRGITKRFPGVVANDGVDFEAAEGEVHALLGENGAGKSTLSSILTGLYRPDEGEIRLYDEPVEFHAPRDALDAGICMVHQHFRLVPTFTVAENVLLGDHRDEGRRFLVNPRGIERRVTELGRRYDVAVDPRARVWQLSIGEQQRVEILKALYREARILILDEPTAVLTPQEAESLFATLRTIAAEGRTVVFISHKLHEVQAVADRVTVLRGGRTVATLRTAETTPRSLAALMVGREVEAAQRRERTAEVGAPALELADVWAKGDRGGDAVRGVTLQVGSGEIVAIAGVAGNGQRELAETVTGMRPLARGALTVAGRALRGGDAVRGVTLQVGSGEIVAIAGVAGNGQRELAETVTGMRPPARGTLRVAGRALRGGDPRAAIRAGVGHVPEDRLHTGVAPSLSVASNVVLKAYRDTHVRRGPLLRLGAIRERAEGLIHRYDVKTAGPNVPARQLSGGNLQKVVLGREFLGEPLVLVAASPTRGLDVAATDAVHRYLREGAAEGMGILLIGEDLDEILALADRIVVMYEGRLVGELDASTATREEVGLLMAGGS